MIASLLKTLFGDKSTKERKEYQPIIDKSNALFAEFQSLTDDQLRGKTAGFKAQIHEATKELENEIANLKEKANDLAISVDEKERIFEKIDGLDKEVNEAIEAILLTILPDAFAVIKETARRWAENGKLEVKAQDFDKELASKKDGITISDDKAIWANEWTAAGTPVRWTMVHYDVQLMGGAV